MKNWAGIRVRGHIRIATINHTTGEVVVVYDDHNLVVDAGLAGLGDLLAQDGVDPADFRLTDIKFGEGNDVPVAGDTDLIGPTTFTNPITMYTTNVGSTQGLHEFSTTLSTGDFNGNLIREVGLMFSNGNLFARQVTPTIEKTPALSVSVDWRVQFSDS